MQTHRAETGPGFQPWKTVAVFTLLAVAASPAAAAPQFGHRDLHRNLI
jgi:hypothetical protein